MTRTHAYELSLHWTGDRGSGTSGYRAYSRDHEVRAPGKPTLAGSSDAAFRGDPQRWSPEDLLVAALSSCHLLWYLHLAAETDVLVVGYTDSPTGSMLEEADGSGRFTEVVLHPTVTVAEAGMRERAQDLHRRAAEMCFIARSVAFPVLHRPTPVAVAGPRHRSAAAAPAG